MLNLRANKKWQENRFQKSKETHVREFIHSNMFELSGVLTSGDKRYFKTFIDDHSRYMHVYVMWTKNEVFNKFKEFKSKAKKKEKWIKILRTDVGGKYFGASSSLYYEENRIIHQ